MSSVNFNPFAGGELLRVAPASGPQREIIASAQISDVANTAFNEAVSVRLKGELDVERLRRCFAVLIERHDSLRATFSRNGSDICLHESSPFELEFEDISHLSENEQETLISDLWKNIALSPMNLEEGPLLFAWLKKLENNTYELIIAAHHVVCDGWSIGLMLSELSAAYGNGGSLPEATEPAPSFFDYAELTDSREISNRDNDYWIQRFADAPPSLDLPLDFPRPHFRTFEATRLDYRMDPQLAKSLPKAAAALRVSMVNMVLASYFVLLHRLTGNEDIVVGLPVAGQATQNRLGQLGHMVHLLPIRIQLSADTPFFELCQQVKSEVINATEHSNFTFGKLIESMKVDRTRVPLINTIFNIDQPLEHIQFGDVAGTVRTVPRAAENFEMFLNILPSSESLTIEATYSTALFSEATIHAWLGALERILVTATRENTCPLGSIALADQEPAPVQNSNNTDSELTHQTAIEAFRSRVSAHPESIACAFGASEWSYQDLDNQSQWVAAALAAQGIGAGATVALCAERSDSALAAILGILKLGAIYLPLDPDFPEARLQYMIEDSGATALISDASTPEPLRSADLAVFDLKAITCAPDSERSPLPTIAAPSPDQTAYIIYTSGSTGKPKGVLISHRALINFLESMAGKPGCSASDRLLAVTTFSFDISLLELFLPLVTGATTVIADKESVKDGEKLRALILQHRISLMQATPATWRMLLDTDWKHDGLGMKGLCGGEPLPRDLVRDLSASLRELWNMYGPTETTVWSTCHPLLPTDRLISVGRPIQNTQIHILDRERRPLPVSCPGELYIGGLGLAQGYHNRTELTAAKFIQHPRFGRLYATGDLAKWSPDGTIQHLGRMDDQVKVRGYRIELGDIETALCTCPGVRAACAYVWELAPGDTRIVGCIVPETGAEPGAVALRKALRQQLPAYMVPQHFLTIESVPLSPSGKIDRRRLPQPELRESSILKASALANETEELVAGVWSDVLNSSGRIVREDNFFSLGGHSLLALQAIRKIEGLTGIRLRPEDIVGLSLSEIAEKLSHSKPADPQQEETPANLPVALQRSLSREQMRILMRQLAYPDNVCNNLPASWLLEGELDVDVFTRSLARVFERQTALRTVVTHHQGDYRQAILPLKQLNPLEVIDLSDQTDPQTAALEHARELAFRPFPVLDRPLVRSSLFLLGPGRYLYVLVPHQLVFDGWSFDIFLKELESAYLVLSGAGREQPNKLAFEFRDYAEWSRDNGVSTEDIDYHRARLEPLLKGPAIGEKGPAGAGDGHCVRDTLAFPEADLESIEQQAKALELKPHELLFGLFAEAVCRVYDSNSVVLGVPTSGRHRADVINLIGSFVSTIPCKMDAPQAGRKQRLLSLCAQLRQAMQHHNLSYADVVRNTPAEQQMFPHFVKASFAFQDIRNRPTAIAGLSLKQLDVPRRHTEHPIEFWVRIQPGGFLGVFDFDSALVEPATVEDLKNAFSELVRDFASLTSDDDTEALDQLHPEPPKKPFWRKLFQ